jgi:hypothetical protein
MVCFRKEITIGHDISVSADEEALALMDGISLSIVAKDSDDRWLNALDNS